MKRSAFGILGIILGIIAVLIGTYAISLGSSDYWWNYLLLAVICGILITRTYCTKCPITKTCVHILPGYIARYWQKREGPYTAFDMLVTVVLFVFLILPPQAFLLTEPLLLLLFWICLLGAALCSYLLICPGCGNRFCPFRREG
jgi:cobalamin synthase